MPFAHTPSFVGSHVTGWDNMMEGILRYFTLNKMEGKDVGSSGKVNVVPGFEYLPGQLPRDQAHAGWMDVDYTMLSTRPKCWTPGRWRIPHVRWRHHHRRSGSRAERRHHPAAATVAPGKDEKFVETTWNHDVPKLNIPMGVDWTDAVAEEGLRK